MVYNPIVLITICFFLSFFLYISRVLSIRGNIDKMCCIMPGTIYNNNESKLGDDKTAQKPQLGKLPLHSDIRSNNKNNQDVAKQHWLCPFDI
ncbi:hypothetical protein F4680DRAFT_412500 [Xylaria scruposa]|nr:hypothetical protein F4680DRAFT_412500 [Xylaria scruposa]